MLYFYCFERQWFVRSPHHAIELGSLYHNRKDSIAIVQFFFLSRQISDRVMLKSIFCNSHITLGARFLWHEAELEASMKTKIFSTLLKLRSLKSVCLVFEKKNFSKKECNLEFSDFLLVKLDELDHFFLERDLLLAKLLRFGFWWQNCRRSRYTTAQ